MPRGCSALHDVNPNQEKKNVCKKCSPKVKQVYNRKVINNRQENIANCMSLDPFWECETLRGVHYKNPISAIFDTLNQENNA